MGTAPPLITLVFLATVALVAIAFVLAVRHVAERPARKRWMCLAAGALLLWLALTAAVAASGILRAQHQPPPLLAFLAVCFGATLLVTFSPLGRRLTLGVPLAWLVGVQAFRIPVEWVLHSGAAAGLVPVQMTWAGRNWDVLTGLTALPLALLLAWTGARRGAQGSAMRGLVLAWNVAGLSLLANVVTVAVLSAPTPLRVFVNEPANVFVSYVPWVWLPAVLVQAALLGHLLVFRRLWREWEAGALAFK